MGIFYICYMHIELKKPITEKKIVEALSKIKKSAKKKGFDPEKYAGKVKFDVDPIKYQKQVRDEWE